jgi:predicted phosphodiesterase
MEKAAYEYAKRRKADAIISGHTHKPMIKML